MTTLAAWIRERLPGRVFVPVVAGLALLAFWASAPGVSGTAARSLGLATTFMALFVIRFRLRDDLADREVDRVRHPDRASVRLAPRPLVAAQHTLLGLHLGLAAAAGTVATVAGVVALEAAFALAYRLRRLVPSAWWRYPILLSKYPAFVLATGLAWPPIDPTRLAAAALVAYVAAWIYESVHDTRPQGAWS